MMIDTSYRPALLLILPLLLSSKTSENAMLTFATHAWHCERTIGWPKTTKLCINVSSYAISKIWEYFDQVNVCIHVHLASCSVLLCGGQRFKCNFNTTWYDSSTQWAKQVISIASSSSHILNKMFEWPQSWSGCII